MRNIKIMINECENCYGMCTECPLIEEGGDTVEGEKERPEEKDSKQIL